MSGVDRIAAERRRQIESEGFDVERDVALYTQGELLLGALCYLRAAWGLLESKKMATEGPAMAMQYGDTEPQRVGILRGVEESERDPLGYHFGRDENGKLNIPDQWPWSADWWKPSEDEFRNLEKAGALIAAEVDRLETDGELKDEEE